MKRSSICAIDFVFAFSAAGCPARAQVAASSAEKDHPVRITSLPPKDWSDWLAWGSGIALVLIGGGGVWLGLRTLRAIEKQASAQMDADRAWVLVNAVSNPEDSLYSPERSGYTPGIVFMVEITGNTPATIIRESFRCRIVPASRLPRRWPAGL